MKSATSGPSDRPRLKLLQLHGELASLFGATWELDILTPAEGLKAIDANRPGFLKHLTESGRQGIAYRMLLDGEAIGPGQLVHPFSRETFHLVPVIGGAGEGAAVGKLVVGAVIAIASMGLGVAAMGAASGLGASEVIAGGGIGMAMSETALLGMSYGTIALMGATLAFSGVSQLLAKNPDASSERSGSYSFSGAVNTTDQGGPIPIGYGELVIGSTVVSSGIKVAEQATA